MEDFKREKIEFLKPMSLKTNFLRVIFIKYLVFYLFRFND